MEQHQWTPKSIAEMAPRYHHFHVRIVDVALGLFRRTHIRIRRHMERQSQCVLRQ
jgi:hypothetical protein